MTKLPKSISDNLHFLCVEVDSQLANLQQFFVSNTLVLMRRVLDRSGYAYNLKMRIHSSCINQLSSKNISEQRKLQLRSLEFVATELERLTELARESVRQIEYVDKMDNIRGASCAAILQLIRDGILLVEPSIQQSSSNKSIEIAKLSTSLQKKCAKLSGHYTQALKKKHKQTEDLLSAIFVAHSLKQMGDALMNISESIISANLGQTVSLERYSSLQSLLQDLNGEDEDLYVEPIAETRSGSAIAGISGANQAGYLAIFKDGEKQKVKEERQGVKSWHEIYPGLAPKILSYKKRGESAALLIEHLPGHTFEQILLNEPESLLQETLAELTKTLKAVWQQTRNEQINPANFIDQLQKRLPDVYRIHPEFQCSESQICGVKMASFDQLLVQAAQLERQLSAPFSVYIHGDFNLDNIIYDPLEKRINFIDLHRSRYMDYVQDVSVFMVSNYRLQILDSEIRQRILHTAKAFYAIARRYALRQKDTSFELRLALGLVRSFATSTRFILDKSQAKKMMLRSRYLLELCLQVPENKRDSFRIPLKEIFSE